MRTHGELAADLTELWAKRSRTPGSNAFHPLICHMIDVAMVARTMWERVVPPAARAWFATGLGLDESAAGQWATLWTGLHDIGKCSPAFQWQTNVAPHGTISTVALRELLSGPAFGLAPHLATRVAAVVGGHHGTFPPTDAVERASRKDAAGGSVWREARADLMDRLAKTLEPAAPPTGEMDNARSMWLAGLVSIADWIGSDETFFPYAADGEGNLGFTDLGAYGKEAARQAEEALDQLRWTAWPTTTPRRRFGELFPWIDEPRPVQTRVETLAMELSGPSLVILEVPMGEGKTEAAMYLADEGNAVHGLRGHYFALPTQATSDQVFGRVRDFLSQRYPREVVNVQLLHGHAALSAEFDILRAESARLLEPTEVYGEDGNAFSGVVAGEWFTHRKRGLLAPFGVGTIDQALLAVLQTKHLFVRMFGLANKTVIVDEVHAYDAYMSTLLERLLAWLGALGTSVVLLSATLPGSRRQRLLAAYAEGRGLNRLVVPTARYPRVAWLSDAGAGAETVATSGQARRTVRLAWIDEGEDAAAEEIDVLGKQLQAALADGGCAAVICNTVRRAQETYRGLCRFFAADELDLLHARFPFEDREAREQQALVRFGKTGGQVTTIEGERPVRRPERAVLVATQIIEQSLDLDFDLMVTDLAPVDLVLQRTGRLHRHERDRPPRLEAPTLWVRGPARQRAAVVFDPGSARVYDEHVLLRSWLALRDRDQIGVPDDIEDLIEWVYDDDRPCPADSDDALPRRWAETQLHQREAIEAERRQAQDRWVKRPDFDGPLWRMTGEARAEDAPDLHAAHQALTRLAEPSVDLVVLYGSEERPCLDAGEQEPVRLGHVPSVADGKRLLRRSVRVSDRLLVYALREREVPSGWRRSSLLCRHRAVVLDHAGGQDVGKYRLSLEEDIGLVITARGKEA
ncbi:MAG: CRISPR-associated helicase Cas3' [Thermomicrobiales bacterium]